MNEAYLAREAQELDGIAQRLLRGPGSLADPSAAAASLQLGRSSLWWSLALVRAGEAGKAAMGALDRVLWEPDAPPGIVERIELDSSDLAYLTVLLVGDLVLEDLAWAELLRREERPDQSSDGWVPSFWSRFMTALDRCPGDPMTGDARYVDITLCVARDALGAHRNPQMVPLTSWSYSTGAMQQTREGSGPDNLKRAVTGLRLVRPEIPRPPNIDLGEELDVDTRALRWRMDEETEFVRAIAGALRIEDRKLVKSAHRLAGFAPPPVAEMAQRVISLLGLHLEARGLPEPTPHERARR